MQKNRTHNCGELTAENIGQSVKLMGWVNSLRNLGGLIFLDLRDHHGITQIIINPDSPYFEIASTVRAESVVEVLGKVIKRNGAVNAHRKTGEIEVVADSFRVESASEILPFPVFNNVKEESEDTRLKYRFLDLRTERMHKNIVMRSKVTQYVRTRMFELGFLEIQTPILTSSSPEGARDFLVPSRLHPGKFYALPQAPQQFKQLLMCSGFDRYFQIAPCFRDEDARADRSPGEFYQIDIEMCYATQDEIFTLIEQLMVDIFKEFSTKPLKFSQFPRIPYREAIEKYGSDKPDLRFDLTMSKVEEAFASSNFSLFQNTITEQGVIRAIKVPGGAAQSRKFFEQAEQYAKDQGLGGLPYLLIKSAQNIDEWKGSVAKFLSPSEKTFLVNQLSLSDNDAVFFILGRDYHKVMTAGGRLRLWLGDMLNLRSKNEWAFCWVVDFPFFEMNEEENKIDFSHNPFSMPQGGLEALNTKNPLDILAYQYDIVLNGVELSSGAIRNHNREIMKKAFELAGYSEEVIHTKFPALWNAFAYGAPPHGGIAPGLDRIIMFLLEEPSIREVIAFPLNPKAQDLLMSAPGEVSEKQLREVHINIRSKA